MTMTWLTAHVCPPDCQHLTYLLFCSPQSWNSLSPTQLQLETIVIFYSGEREEAQTEGEKQPEEEIESRDTLS